MGAFPAGLCVTGQTGMSTPPTYGYGASKCQIQKTKDISMMGVGSYSRNKNKAIVLKIKNGIF